MFQNLSKTASHQHLKLEMHLLSNRTSGVRTHFPAIDNRGKENDGRSMVLPLHWYPSQGELGSVELPAVPTLGIRLKDIIAAARYTYPNTVGVYEATDLILFHHDDAQNRNARPLNPGHDYDVAKHGGDCDHPIVFCIEGTREVEEPEYDTHDDATASLESEEVEVVAPPPPPVAFVAVPQRNTRRRSRRVRGEEQRVGSVPKRQKTNNRPAARNGNVTVAAAVAAAVHGQGNGRPVRTRIIVPHGTGKVNIPEFHDAIRARIAEYRTSDNVRRRAMVDEMMDMFEFRLLPLEDHVLLNDDEARDKVHKVLRNGHRLKKAGLPVPPFYRANQISR